MGSSKRCSVERAAVSRLARGKRTRNKMKSLGRALGKLRACKSKKRR